MSASSSMTMHFLLQRTKQLKSISTLLYEYGIDHQWIFLNLILILTLLFIIVFRLLAEVFVIGRLYLCLLKIVFFLNKILFDCLVHPISNQVGIDFIKRHYFNYFLVVAIKPMLNIMFTYQGKNLKKKENF
jgi:hypothetical protein